MNRLLTALILFFVACCGNAHAFSVARIFSDHMVLQRDRPVPVWGKATSAARVTVEFAGKERSTTADEQGHWRVEFPALPAGTAGEFVIRSEDQSIVLHDVLVGEVWFAGGQSNMEHLMRTSAKQLPEFDQLIQTADYPRIRIRKVNDGNSPAPKDDLAGGNWVVATPAHTKNFSAVAYLFARRLHLELDVPVGVIEAAWGGTPIEPHIPAAAFTGHPTLEKILELGTTKDLKALHELAGGTFARSDVWLASQIYNGRIAPVTPYAIRGVIWYQGESNCGHAEDPREYSHKMRALVKGWRDAWKRPDLPFYFVQLPQWKSSAWRYLREEQVRASNIPHTGMAVTIDLNFHNNIHPPNKLDVAERLARWPLARDYGRNVAYRSPKYRDHSIEGGSVIVNFDHAKDGLVKGRSVVGKFSVTEGATLNGFEVCSKDGVWHNANAKIEGSNGTRVDSLRHRSCSQCATRAIQWLLPQAPWNLYNHAGLPAAPFCSDWERMHYDPKANGH